MPNRHQIAAMAIAAIAALSSCGHEDPTGSLRVASTPAGAEITLDGIATGDLTPFEYRLSVGAHTVAVILEGHQASPAQRDVTVSPARLSSSSFTLTPLGELTVTSTPGDGAIVIDGADTGETTPHTLSLPVGEHRVDVRLDGRISDGPQTISLTAGTPAEAAFILHPAGELAVNSTPTGATITLDGVESDATTPHTFTLPEGDHLVRVALAGHTVSPDSIAATVVAGASVTADFLLTDLGTLGTLSVTSLPAGAAVRLDGADTGEITPHVFELAAGAHSVSVSRPGFAEVEARRVDVAAGTNVQAAFALVARKIVLLEFMSGVNCENCPAMNAVLADVEAAGYGPEKMVGIKYSGPFGGADLHFDQSDQTLRTRMTWYADNTAWAWAAPTMLLDGALTVGPSGFPTYDDLIGRLDAALDDDPGFAIDVELIDPTAQDFEVVVELAATRAVANGNAVLNVAIIETPILYDTPQNDAGENEFHWICREFTTAETAPLPVGPDTTAVFEIDVPRLGAWTGVPGNLIAVAFVQDASTLEVLQAGVSGATHSGETP